MGDGLTGLYGVMGGGIALRQWPLDWITILGGLIFGLGAGANGACVFSTLARLADGHVVMLFTLAGWVIGIAALHLMFPDLHRQSNVANQLPAWMLLILGPWMVWEGARILQRLMREGWGPIGASHWPLSLSATLVAAANFGLLSLDGALSNRGLGVKHLSRRYGRCRVHGCLRGRHRSPHDGASRGEPSMWMTHFAETAVQPHQRNGSAHVPAGTPQALRF